MHNFCVRSFWFHFYLCWIPIGEVMANRHQNESKKTKILHQVWLFAACIVSLPRWYALSNRPFCWIQENPLFVLLTLISCTMLERSMCFSLALPSSSDLLFSVSPELCFLGNIYWTQPHAGSLQMEPSQILIIVQPLFYEWGFPKSYLKTESCLLFHGTVVKTLGS